MQFIVQNQQEGFGHAVYCAREKLCHEPFLLLLGDHVYRSTDPHGLSCVQQMMDTYTHHRCSVIGLKKTPLDQVSRFGAVTGILNRDDPGGERAASVAYRVEFNSNTDDGTGSDSNDHHLLTITKMVEKPTQDYAKNNLAVRGLCEDEVLTVFGQYIIDPKVWL